MKIVEIPMIILDIQLFRYKKNSISDSLKTVIKFFEEIKKFNGFCAIDFHSDGFSNDYMWAKIYPEILNWLKINKAAAGSLKYCLDRRRRLDKL